MISQLMNPVTKKQTTQSFNVLTEQFKWPVVHKKYDSITSQNTHSHTITYYKLLQIIITLLGKTTVSEHCPK